MRPGDVLWWVPSSASSVAFFLQQEWLTAVLVGAVLGLFTAFIRDVRREKGFWKWFRGGIKTADEVEEFLDRRTVRVNARRMQKMEGRQQRREYKERHASDADQMKLFPW